MDKTRYPGIFKRGDKYVVKYRDENGVQRYKTGDTLGHARAIQAEVNDARSKGFFREESRLTVSDYYDTWIGTYKGRATRAIRPETIASYRKEAERYMLPLLGNHLLRSITPQRVREFLAALEAKGLSHNSIRSAYTPLRAMLATAYEDGLIAANPCVGVRPLKPPAAADEEDDADAKAMTDQELAAILAALPARHRLFFAFLSETGMRISEAIAVRWSDLEGGTVRVRRRYYKGAYAGPKTANGRRSIPLSSFLLAALKERRQAAPPGDLIFPSQAGTPLNQWSIYRDHLIPAREACGLPWVTLHAFRHTAATRWFRSGMNVLQVASLLGHGSPSFTLSTYLHLLPGDLPPQPVFDALSPLRGDACNQSATTSL